MMFRSSNFNAGQLLNRPQATPTAELMYASAVAVNDRDISSSAPTDEEVKSALKKLMNAVTLHPR